MPARKITTTIFKNFRRVCVLATSRPLGSLRLLGVSKTKPEPLGSGSGFLLLLREEGGDHLGVGLLPEAHLVQGEPEGIVATDARQRVVSGSVETPTDGADAPHDCHTLFAVRQGAGDLVERVEEEDDMTSVSTEGIGVEVAGERGGQFHIFIFVSC